MATRSTHAGGVVLCVLDQLGSEGLAALPRASAALARFASSPLARAAVLDEDAAHHALGTGLDRPDLSAALDKLLETGSMLQATALEAVMAQAEAQRGTFVDFVTENEKPRCCVHLLAHVASRPEDNRHLYELVEALTAAELPYVVHAILGDAGAQTTSAPQRVAQGALEQLEYRLGEVGKLATVMGRDYALGPELDWERAFSAFQAIVRGHEADTAQKVHHALEAAYGAERVDASIEPTRIGGYEGVTGSLRAELPAEAPVWEWHGQDVGIVWVPRGEDASRLVSVLLRRDLPAELEEKITIRGRAVFAFEPSNLASLTSLGMPDIPALVGAAATGPALLESLAWGGKKCRAVFDPSHRRAVRWALGADREPDESVPALEREDARAALAIAADGVRTGELDFQLVAISGAAPAEIDASLEALVDAVLQRGGALVVVTEDAVRIAQEEGQAASASPPRQHRDVFRLAHELLGVPMQDPAAASRRARRRR